MCPFRYNIEILCRRGGEFVNFTTSVPIASLYYRRVAAAATASGDDAAAFSSDGSGRNNLFTLYVNFEKRNKEWTAK